MKPIKLITLLTLLSQAIVAQQTASTAGNDYAAIDKLALQIPDSLTTTSAGFASYISANFTKDIDKVRAIFAWEAENIEYDIEFFLEKKTFKTQEEKISRPLKTHKGICENYATLFNDVCSKAGLKSYVIEGYSRQSGTTDYLAHAWCIAFIDSTWLLFDPTWGAGYVNDKKYYKKINNDFFKMPAAESVKSHMPFDYLWQLLNYPVTNQEFYEGKTQQDKSKPFFNYADSIAAYEKQSHIEQLISSVYRIEKNGVMNSMIEEQLKYVNAEIENYRATHSMNSFNSAVADFNEGVKSFNEFIQYRNKQFAPPKSDAEIQNMIDVSENKINEAKSKLSAIPNPDSKTATMIKQLNKSIDQLTAQIKEQKDWLKIYFSKDKTARKSMFYKRKTTR